MGRATLTTTHRSASNPLQCAANEQAVDSSLEEWMEQTTTHLKTLVASRRWTIGCRIANAFDRLRRRPDRPLPSDQIRRVCEEFEVWKRTAHTSPSSPDIQRFDAWVRELNLAYRSLLRSRRWKLGNSIIGLARGLLLRRGRLASLGLIDEQFRQYSNRKYGLDQREPIPQLSLADLYYHLGFVREKSKKWNEAVIAYNQALKLDRGWRGVVGPYEKLSRIDPTHPDWLYRLGRAQEKTLSKSPQYDHQVGLRLRKHGNWQDAAKTYREAVRLRQQRADYHFRLAHVREKMRDFEGAASSFEQAVKLAPENPLWLYRLARAKEQFVDLEGALEAYDSLLRVDPEHSAARSRAYAIQLKLAHWSEASKNALRSDELSADNSRFDSHFARQPHPASIKKLRGLLESEEVLSTQDETRELLEEIRDVAGSLPPDWWFALHWRFITMGWIPLAYEVKDIAARVMIADAGAAESNTLKSLLDVAKAQVQLGQKDAALQHLHSHTHTSEHAHLAVQKLVADIMALDGDFASLQQMMESFDGVNLPEAEDAFRRLICGRTVAIVGPLTNGLHSGEEIVSHDVIVRPNFLTDLLSPQQASALGTRTDISYFNGVASRMLTREIHEAVQSEKLKIIVLRPFNYRHDRRHIVRPGDLRYNPSESNAYLRARSFGIQRIVHDILRYKPRSVKIFNIDFFISSQSYRKAYKAGELLTDLDPFYLGSGHDFRNDFEFTKCLRDRSLIAGDKIVNEILDRTTEDYLGLLEGYERSVESGSGTSGATR